MNSLVNTVGENGEPDEALANALKIDLSNVSYLKPHIMNPKTYELAHKGFRREEILKTDAIKSLEQ